MTVDRASISRRIQNVLQCDDPAGFPLWKPWAMDLADDAAAILDALEAAAAALAVAKEERDLFYDRLEEQRVEARTLREALNRQALEQIASCRSVVPGDVVDIARAALAKDTA